MAMKLDSLIIKNREDLKPASDYQLLRRSWSTTDAADDFISLSDSFQLDFVVHNAPDGFRYSRCTRLKK